MSSLIRNFSIIAHIDAGKSTLADRMLEVTGTVQADKMTPQLLDSNPIERERGITIKLAPVAMNYQGYTLNLIDTPGHVDFNYEVERALQACEGAILLVDATKGVQAQTVANLRLAKNLGLTIIPVVNKIDAPLAEVNAASRQIKQLLGIGSEPLLVSAKTGEGVEILLQKIISDLPSPRTEEKPLHALVFNSTFDTHLGVIAFVKIISGNLKSGDKMSFLSSGKSLVASEIGIFSPGRTKKEVLTAGNVGYIITGLKDIRNVLVGDTLCLSSQIKQVSPIPGFRKIHPNVFLDFYPADGSQYRDLVDALEKLKLNDSSLTTQGINSPILGQGVKVGFLGMLHSEVVGERLEREFGLPVISVSPSVEYKVKLRSGEEKIFSSPSDFPDPAIISQGFEPMAAVNIVVTSPYVGAVMELCQELRGNLVNVSYLDELVEIDYFLPLIEVITALHDSLKSVSQGFGSMNYELAGWQEAELVKLDVLLNHELFAPMSVITVKEKAYYKGKKISEKLKEAIPRQQFEIPIQVAIGGQIVARETIKAYRKDVDAKLHGGDFTRNLKLLNKQKKGKARMKQFGRVSVPQEAFLAIAKS
ncbi:elongation factor 4 [Candidatus Collierbacteria bacterium RIFOXYB2_FULL_46_14]|uniref:Elongation factor 4 n=1 Tax=Candidatus Collierbacteria bacterium GW2011_GWA2_46_26 TaxID=1618381 RepID=A0A0G1PJ87_9BACT|nr:MAG: Elongation factor 4 [Candidatus Collierbacteria bacterium GW2011_GWC2_44_13]KKU32811.1 MAG: Elongation factor 4 [Candidatus Collierbacteria bacterium GW2011_GWA2_46_26]OGD72790.1 MAG: elongation factor 4 [Candidatus Collierbacteria bacterium RIFOXYB2_FULL_46_14]OGD75832.1 MAG: elongation factor 4 [Candidatus Collierbacteria bacterium RIFOXYA2_FULL_46_20]OGD77168.1 MAG: elongation factor 4 [Candidatus Collierbacteria bacterium RIFOXYC2_FULL_43_15]OGD80458.1 MAG: elongation factor 4 [Pse